MVRRRKNTAQKIVNIATTGMPRPVRSIASSRIGSFLITVGLPILIATGIVKISWNGALPSFTVDEQRAGEVRERLRDRAEDWREDLEHRLDADHEHPSWNPQDRAAEAPWRNYADPTPNGYEAPRPPVARVQEDQFPRR